MEEYHREIYRPISVPIEIPDIGLTNHQARVINDSIGEMNRRLDAEVMQLRHEIQAIIVRLLIEKY
ncbi:hypothetical protein D9M69_355720 [compost metagenome]